MGTHDPSKSGTDGRHVDASSVESTADSALSPAAISELLAAGRRRYALYYLVGCDYAASVEEVTEQVAVWETETSASEIEPSVYEAIRTDLVHVHLPKLAAADAIEYDEDSELVTLADGIDRLTETVHRAAAREHERR